MTHIHNETCIRIIANDRVPPNEIWCVPPEWGDLLVWGASSEMWYCPSLAPRPKPLTRWQKFKGWVRELFG